MRALVATCLRLRFLVILAAVAFSVIGFRLAMNAKLDVFPEFSPPRVEIQTEAPGLSVIEVETLVSTPIERALQGVAFAQALRSKSVLGLSSVVIVFREGTDLMTARQLVQERLASAVPQLPAAAKAPVMLSPLSSTSRVLKIGLSSKTLSQTQLSDLARFTVRPRLMAVSGVANVAIWGQRDRQVHVRVDPEALRARGVALDDVVRATREAVTPASGGFVDTPNQRFAVTHVPMGDVAHLAEVVVPQSGRTGAPVRLSDVAVLEEGNPVPIGDAVIGEGPGLLLIVEKQPWANTLAVTREVERALAAEAPALAGVTVDSGIFRPATFIERALTNLERSLAIGCALVVIILFAFLYDLRTALVSVVAIPLSLVGAAAVLSASGATLDTMTVAGLVIALGEVVDDAIIDVENILRRLALERLAPRPRPAFTVVLEASLEVRSAVVYATLVVVLVFVPVYFMEGLAGAFFRPLAVSYVLAVLVSLGVALLVTPALSLWLLPSVAGKTREGPLARVVRERYSAIVARAVRKPKTSGAVFGIALVFAGATLPFLGESFLPDFHETDFLMHWVGKPGTSIDEMRRMTVRASAELRAIPGVRGFGSHIGRAEVADEVVGPNFAELWISLDDGVDYQASVARIQATVDGYPGLTRDVQTYLQERMKEVLTGASGSIVVRISGSDLGVLRSKAAEVSQALADVPGIANLKVEPQVLVPQVAVELDLPALARVGLGPADVRRSVGTLLQGTRVGEVYRGDQVVDVVVTGGERWRSAADPSALSSVRLATAQGADVALGDVAKVTIVPAPNVVQRESAARRIDVTCDAKGRDLGAVVADVTARVGKVSFPPGHYPEILGEHAARTEARTRLWGLALLALLGIACVLYADFRSARMVAFVMGTLPFALVGGVLGVLLTGRVISLGSLVGFVTVLGIAARNGILMVSHFRHLEREEGMAFGEALVVRGATERVVPIVMTALATGLALVPILAAGHRPGNEIEHPMAIVIFGGLATSTMLNLFVVPALYLALGKGMAGEGSEDDAAVAGG